MKLIDLHQWQKLVASSWWRWTTERNCTLLRLCGPAPDWALEAWLLCVIIIREQHYLCWCLSGLIYSRRLHKESFWHPSCKTSITIYVCQGFQRCVCSLTDATLVQLICLLLFVASCLCVSSLHIPWIMGITASELVPFVLPGVRHLWDASVPAICFWCFLVKAVGGKSSWTWYMIWASGRVKNCISVRFRFSTSLDFTSQWK